MTQPEKKENVVKTEEKTDDYQASLKKLSNEIKKELATPQPLSKPAPAPATTNVSDPIPVDKILEEDVLMGRGKRVSEWPGNIHFRQVINRFRDDYSKAARSKKVEIAKQVMACIHEIGGRFLKENEDEVTSNANSSGGSSTTWVVVEPARAVEKTCQALREKEKARTPDKNPFTDPKKKTKLSPYTPPPSKLKSAGSCSDGETNISTAKKSSDKRSASKLPKGRPRKRSKSTEEGEGTDGGGDERSEKKEEDKQKDQKEKASQSATSKENGETKVATEEAKTLSQSAETENDEKEKNSTGLNSQTVSTSKDSHRPLGPKEEQDTDPDRRHENKETSKGTKLTDTIAATEQRLREYRSEKLPNSSAQQEIEKSIPNDPKNKAIAVQNAANGEGGRTADTAATEATTDKASTAPKAAAKTSKENGNSATGSKDSSFSETKHTLATENGSNPVAVAKDGQTPAESKSAESITTTAAAAVAEQENSAAV